MSTDSIVYGEHIQSDGNFQPDGSCSRQSLLTHLALEAVDRQHLAEVATVEQIWGPAHGPEPLVDVTLVVGTGLPDGVRGVHEGEQCGLVQTKLVLSDTVEVVRGELKR